MLAYADELDELDFQLLPIKPKLSKQGSNRTPGGAAAEPRPSLNKQPSNLAKTPPQRQISLKVCAVISGACRRSQLFANAAAAGCATRGEHDPVGVANAPVCLQRSHLQQSHRSACFARVVL